MLLGTNCIYLGTYWVLIANAGHLHLVMAVTRLLQFRFYFELVDNSYRLVQIYLPMVVIMRPPHCCDSLSKLNTLLGLSKHGTKMQKGGFVALEKKEIYFLHLQN